MVRFVRFVRLALLSTLLSACVPAPPVQVQTASVAAPEGFPADVRWDVVPGWIKWGDIKSIINWPPRDGCADAPELRTLDAGDQIDRFGSEGGNFFSPVGESFNARSVPYVCRNMDYRIYRVVKPFHVKACKAAPWFGAPGGAAQFQTTVPAFKLREVGFIEMVTSKPAGGIGPEPQCDGSSTH
jgi:hypothetical protein